MNRVCNQRSGNPKMTENTKTSGDNSRMYVKVNQWIDNMNNNIEGTQPTREEAFELLEYALISIKCEKLIIESEAT